MAGIGFELQRVLRKGGMGSLVSVALSGIMIVAGPWLLSVVGIFLIGRFASFALREGQGLFMGVIIYSYAFSLSIFGGLHYSFTRRIADLVYLERRREALRTLLAACGTLFLLSGAIGAGASFGITTQGLSRPLLFKSFGVLFFATINVVWLTMIFASLLKRYTAIFLVFLGGMTLSVVGVLFAGRLLGLGGAMLGFAAGQLFTAAALLGLTLAEYRPAADRATGGNAKAGDSGTDADRGKPAQPPPPRPESALAGLIAYLGRYRDLFLTGLLYTLGIWIDKFVFWIAFGQPVPGGFMRLFDRYDLAVYFANLTLIPGLVYFVVVLETGFYTSLAEFLRSLQHGTYQSIQSRKYAMVRQLRTGLREQVMFQGVATAAFLILAPSVVALFFPGLVEAAVLRVTLLAVFFQLLFLVVMTILFYFEQYRQAFLSALVFCGLNLVVALATVATPRLPFGASYLAAGVAASVMGSVFLSRTVRKADRLLFARFG
jgi:uncharacterized membrane protein